MLEDSLETLSKEVVKKNQNWLIATTTMSDGSIELSLVPSKDLSLSLIVKLNLIDLCLTLGLKV